MSLLSWSYLTFVGRILVCEVNKHGFCVNKHDSVAVMRMMPFV